MSGGGFLEEGEGIMYLVVVIIDRIIAEKDNLTISLY